MVRPAEYRLRKYDQKMTRDAALSRFRDLKDMMVEQQDARLTSLATLDELIQSILVDEGIDLSLIHI